MISFLRRIEEIKMCDIIKTTIWKYPQEALALAHTQFSQIPEDQHTQKGVALKLFGSVVHTVRGRELTRIIITVDGDDIRIFNPKGKNPMLIGLDTLQLSSFLLSIGKEDYMYLTITSNIEIGRLHLVKGNPNNHRDIVVCANPDCQNRVIHRKDEAKYYTWQRVYNLETGKTIGPMYFHDGKCSQQQLCVPSCTKYYHQIPDEYKRREKLDEEAENDSQDVFG